MQRKRHKKKRVGILLIFCILCIGGGMLFVPRVMQPEILGMSKIKSIAFYTKKIFRTPIMRNY